MRVLCLCILVFLGLAGVLAIRSDDHGVLLETGVDKASMEATLAVNQAVLSAQEALMDEVAKGVILTDGQIDAAVKTAFEPIFSKCEAILNAKAQRKCLLKVAAAKKTTKKGCKAGCKKNATKAAPAPVVAAKPVVPVANVTKPAAPKVQKSAVQKDTELAKKHAAKAKAYKTKADKYAKLAAASASKLQKDVKKEAAKAAKAQKKIAKKIAKANPKAAKKIAKAAKKAAKSAKKGLKAAKKLAKKVKKDAKKEEEKAAAFLSESEFLNDMMDAEAATEDALDITRQGLAVFLEESAALEPSANAAEHLESIDVSLIDLASLDIPEVNAAEIDNLLEQAEMHSNEDVISMIEAEAEAEAEAEVEAQETPLSLAEVHTEVETHAAVQHKVVSTALSTTGVESHEALVAAAEAEMERDLNAVKKDILDLSDLEAIPEL